MRPSRGLHKVISPGEPIGDTLSIMPPTTELADTIEPGTILANKPMNSAPKRPHVDLRSLPPQGYVDGIYSLQNPQIGTTRGGKPFLKCLLRAASGEVA